MTEADLPPQEYRLLGFKPYPIYRLGIEAISGLLFLLFGLAYATLSPSLSGQHWDSLVYGYQAEVLGIKAIMGNHPLGHFFLNFTLIAAQQLGYNGRALPLFVVINALISGITLGLLFRFSVLSMRNSVSSSLGLSLLLGGSYSFWRYTGTADIYSIALCFSLLSWLALHHDLVSHRKEKLFLSGTVTGLAILAHQFNVTLLAVGVFLIWNWGGNKRARTVSFLGCAALTFILGSWLLGYLATSSPSITGILNWSRGYFADPTYGRFLRLESLPVAWATATRTFLHIAKSLKAEVARDILLITLAIVLTWGIFRQKALRSEARLFLWAAVLQILLCGLLIVWWEPYNTKFWLCTFIPVMVVLACITPILDTPLTAMLPACPRQLSHITAILLPLFAAAVLFFNLALGIIGDHQINPEYQEAIRLWTSQSNQEDVLLPDTELLPYLRYWADRPYSVNVYYLLLTNNTAGDRFSQLRGVIDSALCSHKTVLFAPILINSFGDDQFAVLGISSQDLLHFFAGYHAQEVFEYINLLTYQPSKVYTLTANQPCPG